jgi:hypothetical protein
MRTAFNLLRGHTMETDPTSHSRRPAVAGAELTHRPDGTAVIRLRASHRTMEGLLWGPPGASAGVALVVPSGFDVVIERLAVHLTIGGAWTLLVRGSESGSSVSDLRAALAFFAAQGIGKFALGGAGQFADAAVAASVIESESRACALFSPTAANLPIERLGDRSCLIACGEDDEVAAAISARGGRGTRLMSFARAPEGLAEVAGDLAATWVPAIREALA